MRSDVAYVVAELQRIGRELAAGSWSRGARPITVPESLAVIAEAMSVVLFAGARSVVDEMKRHIAEIDSLLAK
jgi:hypothetical protein